MQYKNIEVRCPACQGELEYHSLLPEAFHCTNCDNSYPVIAEIPDFRIFSDPYIDIESDRSKGKTIEAQLSDHDFEGLIDYYYSITDVVPPAQAQIYKRGLMSGVAKSEAALSAWERKSGRSIRSTDRVLEIGCGTGSLLVAASRKAGLITGIDIAFRWLVVAKKRLEEAGVDIPLFCACAEALPFPADYFDVLAAESTIEQLQDQEIALEDAYRVLSSRGHIFITTPNRYSLGPDPNVNVWAGGYLPERLLEAIVRRQGGIPPKRHLLTAGELRQRLIEAGFVKPDIRLADIPEAQRKGFSKGMRIAIDGYSLAKKLPLTKQLLYQVGPLFYAIATKPD